MAKFSTKNNNTYAIIKKRVAYIILHAILIAVAIVLLFPFLYMLFAGFRSQAEMREYADLFYLLPKEFSLWGYEKLFSFNPNQFSFMRGFWNTLLIEASFLFVGIFTDVIVAYGLAKVKFKGRDTALLTLLIGPPFIVVLMPHFTMWSKMGLVGTFWPLVLPHFLGTMGVAFYLERYMQSLPGEIFEAGTMDGLGHFGKIFRIALPLSIPAIVVQSVFMFIAIWNDLLAPDMYLTRIQDKTLQVMLMSLTSAVQAGRASDQPVIMAAATLSSLPILILYLSCQHLFVNSMAATAVKG